MHSSMMSIKFACHLVQDRSMSSESRVSQSKFSISSRALPQSACEQCQIVRRGSRAGLLAILSSTVTTIPRWSELDRGGVGKQEVRVDGFDISTRSISEWCLFRWM